MPFRSLPVRRIAGAAAVTLGVFLAAFTACYTDTNQTFGPPGSLDLQQFPDPPDAPPLSCEGSTPGLDKDGGCSVSWNTTIFPKLQVNGAWKCGNGPSCHGTDRAPAIVADDPNATYTNFTTYKLNQTQTYVATGPGALSPDASAILCNLKIDQVCGTTMPPTPLMCGQDIDDLRQWLACGAPNN